MKNKRPDQPVGKNKRVTDSALAPRPELQNQELLEKFFKQIINSFGYEPTLKA